MLLDWVTFFWNGALAASLIFLPALLKQHLCPTIRTVQPHCKALKEPNEHVERRLYNDSAHDRLQQGFDQQPAVDLHLLTAHRPGHEAGEVPDLGDNSQGRETRYGEVPQRLEPALGE